MFNNQKLDSLKQKLEYFQKNTLIGDHGKINNVLLGSELDKHKKKNSLGQDSEIRRRTAQPVDPFWIDPRVWSLSNIVRQMSMPHADSNAYFINLSSYMVVVIFLYSNNLVTPLLVGQLIYSLLDLYDTQNGRTDRYCASSLRNVAISNIIS